MTEQADDLYRAIIEAAPDAVILADREGIIRLWNSGAQAVFGFSAAEAVGQSLDLIIPERQRQRHWEGYDRVMATGVTKYGRDLLAVPALNRAGARISIEFSIVVLRDETGAVTGIAAIMRDVTERYERDRATQRRLQELESQLQPAAKPAS